MGQKDATIPPQTAKMEPLELVLAQLTRPLGYAAKAVRAQRQTVRGLGRYVSHRLAQVGRVRSPESQRLLRQLGRLFRDYDQLNEPQQACRLSDAQALLEQLRTRLDHPRRQLVEEGHPASFLAQSIELLPGVGTKRAVQFRRLGVTTIEELLTNLPWRYEDRSRIRALIELEPQREQTVVVEVKAVGGGQFRRRRLAIVELVVGDQTGLLSAKWFNQPYLRNQFRIGQKMMLTGRPRPNRYGGPRFQMENPQYELVGQPGDELLHSGRIVPIYHETKGLTSRIIRTIVHRTIEMYGKLWPEVIPSTLRWAGQRMTGPQAIEEVHFPPAGTSIASLQAGQSPALRRLIFEELFVLSLGLACRKRVVAEEHVPARLTRATRLADNFLGSLGFSLTPAQRRVLGEIEDDLRQPKPMNRLLQGDVGCGKTVVAVAAMLMAVDGGAQAALMVPTEILAEQHAGTLRRWLNSIGMNDVVVLTSGVRSTVRRAALARLRDGSARIVIGTHALISTGVVFHRLGLVVIDEQHKFGVLQRADLVRKGYHPDVLVMTATPIPRTMALTVYGDLDISVIDEVPPGRPPVTTQLFVESQRRQADRLLLCELNEGRQAYVIYPLVDTSEKSDLKDATRMAESFQRQFAQFRVGLLHGRMTVEEKERIMNAFSSGEVQILVATSVVEVGIDVPNATVMVIEHAERFGLAQLHQFRGRVGRGRHQSYCLLVAGNNVGREGHRRLEAIVGTRDGFRIAEEDLAIRGPGEFFGTRQAGLPELRVAHLLRDASVLEEARAAAQEVVSADPDLSQPQHRTLRALMERRWGGRISLMTVR